MSLPPLILLGSCQPSLGVGFPHWRPACYKGGFLIVAGAPDGSDFRWICTIACSWNDRRSASPSFRDNAWLLRGKIYACGRFVWGHPTSVVEVKIGATTGGVEPIVGAFSSRSARFTEGGD